MKDSRSGFLAWFAGHHVAGNLLMIFILAAGAMSLTSITRCRSAQATAVS